MPIVPDGEGGCYIVWLDQRGQGDIYAQHILHDGTIDPRWNATGRPVINQAGLQNHMKAASDGAGGIIVVWCDRSDRENPDIFAQRINPAGDRLWNGSDGVPVCDRDSSWQILPKICSDGSGGAFIIWIDHRDPPAGLYAQRINADGNLLWGDDNEGAIIQADDVAANASGREHIIIPSDDNRAIVVWQIWGQGYDLNTQCIGGDDEMEQYWGGGEPVSLAIAQRDQGPETVVSDGAGGAYYTWTDGRDHQFPAEDIYSQRINADGESVWRDNGVLTQRGTGFPWGAKVQLSENGCTVLWTQMNSVDNGIFIQKLNDGDGRTRWGEDGRVILGGQILGEARLSNLITKLDDEGTFAVTWRDSRYGGLGFKPYIQFYRNQEYSIPDVPPGTSGGIMMSAMDSTSVNILDCCASGDGSVIATWQGSLHNAGDIIQAQKINLDGQLIWGENGVRIANPGGQMGTPFIVSDDSGGAIIIWSQRIERAWVVFAQRVNVNGEIVWRDEPLRITGEGTFYMWQPIEDGEGGVILVLGDPSDESNVNLLITRLDTNGEFVWEQSMLLLCDEPERQDAAKIVPCEDGWLVLWFDQRNRPEGVNTQIYAQFVERDGTFRWDAAGIPICTNNVGSDLDATIDFDGNIWIVWQGLINQARDIYVQKLVPSVEPGFLFDDNGYLVSYSNESKFEPAIAFDGETGVYVTWESTGEEEFGSTDIHAIRLNEYGEAYSDSWNLEGNIVCDAEHQQEKPQIALGRSDGSTGAIIAWIDKRATQFEQVSNVYMQRLAVEGEVSVTFPKAKLLPTSISLSSFPNPFNSSTTISYDVARPGFVRLGVFDLNGREVGTIWQGAAEAGRFSTVWDGGSLVSGQYVIRLKAGGETVTRQITVIK